jgi:hypothetical protein
LATEDDVERVERSHSGEYRRALNVSFKEDTSHDGLDSRLLPASDARDEMEILVFGDEPMTHNVLQELKVEMILLCFF